MTSPQSLTAHPVAALFPMLADDELDEFAADIRHRGLLHPVVLDAEGRVLDGRNRLAACERAGVEPTFITYEGDDPDGYALAANGQRRDMSKKQKAVVAARFSQRENYGDQRRVARALGVPDSSVSEAKVIARHPDLADRVLVRLAPMPFSTALAEARERDRRKAEDERAKQRLRIDSPDLLSLVDEERMSLADAVAALDAREEKTRQEERAQEAQRESDRRAAVTNLRSVLTYLVSESIPPEQLAEQDYAIALDEFKQGDLDFAAQTMAAVADLKRGI